MNYELFIYRQIFDRATNTDQAKDTDIKQLITEIRLESDRILMALQQNIVNLRPSRIQSYIHQHQHGIELILEELDGMQPATNGSIMADRKDQIIEIFYTISENLILQLKKNFPDHFNHRNKIPGIMLKKTNEEIRRKSSLIFETIGTLTDRKDPVDNIGNALHEMFSGQRTITYRQKAYLDSFLDKLTDIMAETHCPMATMDILLHIISLNYNHPAFYNFCCRYFAREVEQCEELSAQYNTLNFIKKSIEQAYSSVIHGYNLDQPAIRHSLIGYIKTEMEYLESMDKIGAHLYHHGLLDERYKVTLSVKQLAIFIHLQVEANIIIAESPKLLHEYISKHYSTNETDRISVKSFKNAYYSASTADLEKVIDKIATMLSLAQEKL